MIKVTPANDKKIHQTQISLIQNNARQLPSQMREEYTRLKGILS
jgi:hypothetical protein